MKTLYKQNKHSRVRHLTDHLTIKENNYTFR